MGHYHRLTLMEREELSRMLAAGSSLRATAHALQRAPSTLSRELARHRTSPATYRAVPAHTNGHPGGPISHGNPGSSRLPSDSAGRSWFGWRNAGRRNRLPMDCAGSILETQRCRSRMKPSMAISMGYPLTPSSAPSPGTSGGGIAFGGPASPGSPPAPSRRW